MTIKDVHAAGFELRALETSENAAIQSFGFIATWKRIDALRDTLARRVLHAIANSDCQDSPSELAAEALKVLEPVESIGNYIHEYS